MTAPVEKTTRYATTVDTLPEAWAFVMNHIDNLGPSPSISIDPFWMIPGPASLEEAEADVGNDPQRMFQVAVEGMIEVEPGG